MTALEKHTSSGAGRSTYFLRSLHFTDAQGLVQQVDESGPVATPGAKIVLGEPGMGKSELIHQLGRRLNVPRSMPFG